MRLYFIVRIVLTKFAPYFRNLQMIIKNITRKLHDTVALAIERHDISRYENTPETDIPIYGVYHVYCDTDWQRMVNDQIGHLKKSGLLDVTTCLYVSCIVKNTQEVDELKRIIDSDKAEIISIETDPQKFEYPALSFLHSKSCEEDCLMYYFHTKGISYQAAGGADKRFNGFKRNIESWRVMMEYFLFDKWRVAVNTLTSGFDTYGCYRLPPPPKPYYLYAGNFWWARSGYLKKLPTFTLDKLKEGRFYAEEWLYTGKPQDFSAFDTMADLYYVNMEPCLYTNRKPPLIKVAAFVFKYNWHKFRKHALGYDYKKEFQRRYQVLSKNQ